MVGGARNHRVGGWRREREYDAGHPRRQADVRWQIKGGEQGRGELVKMQQRLVEYCRVPRAIASLALS